MIRSVVILQPPLVQLNGPYPSGAYLAAFFRDFLREEHPAADIPVRWIDASNLFFRELFSAPGLSRLFALSAEVAAEKARAADAAGDAETAWQIRRYLSLADRWVSWIDDIVAILCGGARELCHAFVRSPAAPRGARMDAYLAELESEPTADDARVLATLAVEDLADYITACYDDEFSLVRYAESIAASERSFSKIEAALSRPMVRDFLEPMLDSLWAGIPVPADSGKILFCVSVPFPGCLVNALAMARSLKRRFGSRAIVSMGGGYVNTELRDCENERLFLYVDSLSFDRGFGGYAGLVRAHEASASAPVPRRLACPPELVAYEDSLTASIVPDYSDIDFSLYPRLSDDPNPMHRLWSDGAWLKAYLAHGCYWHRCSFCDVTLDYIGAYRPVAVRALYDGLRRQAAEKGVRGIHFVDEAAPPRALRDFAAANLAATYGSQAHGSQADALPSSDESLVGASAVSRVASAGLLPFWGNIRFEKTFTRDLADFLAAGGLAGVSGGIEIASPEGFKSVDKGIDLANLVAVCAAFKEAGVLVHSYLIYGYWNESAQGVADSAEVMRQLFAAGLVDSAFWHKFVLTRHSRVYREWGEGQHRGPGGLAPVDEPGDFANNDLRFAGEEDSARYTVPLDSALRAWMAGEDLEKPVRSWFPFSMPAPKIPVTLIDDYIADYERARDHAWNRPCEPAAIYYWAGSKPVLVPSSSEENGELAWWHLGEEIRLPLAGVDPDVIIMALGTPGSFADTPALSRLPRAVFKALRHHGLCKVAPLD
jgi:hypothetical protein